MSNVPSYILEQREHLARIQARRAATPRLAVIGVLIGLAMSAIMAAISLVQSGALPLP